MSLPKYKYLLTYRYSEIIFDLNTGFCSRYIDRKSRTFDQMIQAGRSGKQNIVEAVGESDTTKKNEIKLLGYSKGSFEELLADYEDYSRQHNLPIYPKTSTKILHFRQCGYRLSNISNLSSLGNLIEKLALPASQEEVIMPTPYDLFREFPIARVSKHSSTKFSGIDSSFATLAP